MSIRLRKPYKGFIGRRVLFKDGRRRMLMRNPKTGEHKITLLSRYRVEVKLGRLLLETEQVDHKDEDPSNDSYSNLQVLSGVQNSRKSVLIRSGRIFSQKVQICESCGAQILSDKVRKACSIMCRTLLLKDGRAAKNTKTKTDPDVVSRIRSLRSKGLSSYEISKKTGVARNTVMRYWRT